jgi:hypothetical protein
VFAALDGTASVVRIVVPGEGGVAEPPEGITTFPARQVTDWGRAQKDYPTGESPEGIALDPTEQGLTTELNLGGDKLGGWPTWLQEPVYPGKADRLVLQLDSYCNVPHDWGDGGVAYVLRAGHDGELIFTQQSA